MEETVEPQYKRCLDLKAKEGLTQLGVMANFTWHDDPKRLVFVLSRYKFVAKMLSGMKQVLEVGCADAFGTRIVLQEVKQLTAVDFDPVLVKDVLNRMDPHWKFNCKVHDLLQGPMEEKFDAAYALDVIEHIPQKDEKLFLSNICRSLSEPGVLLIGTPSLGSQIYASPGSKEGHINCKDAPGLKELLQNFFHHVFIFSMNDEVVHTGFYPMAQYLFALCCTKKNP